MESRLCNLRNHQWNTSLDEFADNSVLEWLGVHSLGVVRCERKSLWVDYWETNRCCEQNRYVRWWIKLQWNRCRLGTEVFAEKHACARSFEKDITKRCVQVSAYECAWHWIFRYCKWRWRTTRKEKDRGKTVRFVEVQGFFDFLLQKKCSPINNLLILCKS